MGRLVATVRHSAKQKAVWTGIEPLVLPPTPIFSNMANSHEHETAGRSEFPALAAPVACICGRASLVCVCSDEFDGWHGCLPLYAILRSLFILMRLIWTAHHLYFAVLNSGLFYFVAGMRADSAQAAVAPTLPPFPPMNTFSASQLQAMRGMVMPFPPQQHIQSFMSAMQQQMAGVGGMMPPLHFPTMPAASAPRSHNVPRPVVNAKPRGNCRGKWTPEEVRVRV